MPLLRSATVPLHLLRQTVPLRLNAPICRFIQTSTTQRASPAQQVERAPQSPLPPAFQYPSKKPKSKSEGTIASVFASLSGGSLDDALPSRFSNLKRSLIANESHAEALKAAWAEVLPALRKEVALIATRGPAIVPVMQYPGDDVVAQHPISEWVDSDTLAEIRRRGTVIVRGVVPEEQVLQWKEDIKDYVRRNEAHVKGFPAENPQVYEAYWTPPQVAARGHPSLLHTSRALLSLFHSPSPSTTAISLSNPLTYADRLRIRQPGDAKFALGPHIDGGGVERWECPSFRGVFRRVLEDPSAWGTHDAFDLGPASERLRAQTDMYDGPGQCGVFRPWQAWLAMSHTRPGEGTLRVLPNLVEASAYIMLRPFFCPRDMAGFSKDGAHSEAFLAAENWEFDPTTPAFPGCSLGHNIELSSTTHPHLSLSPDAPGGMTSIPAVRPGDFAAWHCDVVHSVEARHGGDGDSSVLYIPAIPLSRGNWKYVLSQRHSFLSGTPPSDFPGGQGESQCEGRAEAHHIAYPPAQRAMGLAPFEECADMHTAEKELVRECNALL